MIGFIVAGGGCREEGDDDDDGDVAERTLMLLLLQLTVISEDCRGFGKEMRTGWIVVEGLRGFS